MWIFSKDGFFSVVKDSYCEDHEVMIRARNLQHLRAMLHRIYGEAQFQRCQLEDDIIELYHSDYRFRYKLPKRDWVIYVKEMAEEIDYPTVKDHVNPDRNPGPYSGVLYTVWNMLRRYQSELHD